MAFAALATAGLVFIGGQGTSLEAFQLSEFARTSREELGLRVISVERNGFGVEPPRWILPGAVHPGTER
jgi:hypothetical protein